jgi:hypothetical protein
MTTITSSSDRLGTGHQTRISPVAVTVAGILIVLLVILLGVYVFTQTSEGAQLSTLLKTQTSPILSGGLVHPSGSTEALNCDGAVPLIFENEIPKMDVVRLQKNPIRLCFFKEQMIKFLEKNGTEENTGRRIDGLTWMAEMISYPDHADLLDSVKAALTDIHDTDVTSIGYIELPGIKSELVTGTETTDVNVTTESSQPRTGETIWDKPATLTPTSTDLPTDTPAPTIIVAHIPTPVIMTPFPNVANVISTQDPMLQIETRKKALIPVFCQQAVPVSDFWALADLSIWEDISFLELRFGEDGLYALSDRVGGNGPDAGKARWCILQITGWPGLSLIYRDGITAQWDGFQIRKTPLFGYGDERSNGRECIMNRLWLFNCSVNYPPDKPTPKPKPMPTWTPRAAISLDQLIGLFQEHRWSLSDGCSIDGTLVLVSIGGCEVNHPTYLVDFAPVWTLYQQGGNIKIGPCVQLKDPKIDYQNTGICIAPFK